MLAPNFSPFGKHGVPGATLEGYKAGYKTEWSFVKGNRFNKLARSTYSEFMQLVHSDHFETDKYWKIARVYLVADLIPMHIR